MRLPKYCWAAVLLSLACNICFVKCENNPSKIEVETCVTCDSRRDLTCQTNSTFSVYEDCPLTSRAMGCYHLISPETNTTKRGCVLNLSESENKDCDENVDNCKKCKGINCNSKKIFERCLVCDLSENEHCATNPKSIETKICQQYENQCFSHIEKPNVMRGCLSDKSSDFISTCRASSANCVICSSTDDLGCNNETINFETSVKYSNEQRKESDLTEQKGNEQSGYESHIDDNFDIEADNSSSKSRFFFRKSIS